ncbi:MAG: U32 family peptidase C-terminal domain-containing protein [Pseudobdellovibrio sp.]
MKSLELLMPAGSVTKMQLALDYGADAVYLGPPLYSLRARENHFDAEELQKSISAVHAQNKKVYMTLNIFSRNRKLKPFSEDVKEFAKMKPDAFIMSDPGLASIAKELCPEIPIHLSVQANCMNWQSVLFWKKSLDIERVILSRELSITEIQEIKQRVPDMQLEAFVHGSICIAYSGRCLLSSYMDKRDANQGVCDNSCREKFNLSSQDYFIEDQENNPGKLYQIDEDQHGTYIMNAKDLCMIDHLEKLANAGVVSFKVEGRTKSEFYAAMIARSYRGALDNLIQKKPVDPYWQNELNKLSNRGYHTGFMLEDPNHSGQNYEASTIYNDKFKFLGLVKKAINPSTILVAVKNKIELNQMIDVISPHAKSFKAKILKITSESGDDKAAVHSGSGVFEVNVSCDQPIPEQALLITHED